MWNYARNFEPFETDCGCFGCTDFNECLIECSYLEYYIEETNSCEPCDPECDDGCVTSDHCRLNFDPLCEEYSGFTV